ncbi:hypothetical protein PG993_011731 [Apiospora rasikravindrae]|uniref:AB hydrolase-1 domain-containing protein n=1 Tax=Apiospora rasikravindrae TaxID=990691 RepID=A0ABR1S0H9_9PEZI
MAGLAIRKAYADTRHGQVHYRYALPSSPVAPPREVLVFLHKSASSSASYEKLMTHYATRGHPCFAPDMPGFGGSFDPSPEAIKQIETKGMRWYVNLVVGIFKQFLASYSNGSGGTSSIHIIGHHAGAALATEMAAVYPALVKSVCLVGPSILSAGDRARMKEKYLKPFNRPVSDGSHLLKTWNYLRDMGIGGGSGSESGCDKGDDDLGLHQREAIDHIRAWKGRNQIYGAIWRQDGARYLRLIQCPVMAMCARDDTLWPYFENVQKVREDVSMVEVKGANFTLDRDVEGIIREWSTFILDTL